MGARVDKYELRPMVNLFSQVVTFPMLFIQGDIDSNGYRIIEIADYQPPLDGTIFTIVDRRLEYVEVLETRKARGVYTCDTPEWYRVKCYDITNKNHIRYAGEDKPGMVLIHIDYDGWEEAA